MTFFLSCEGYTERWYFEWLQKQINADARTLRPVNFKFTGGTPSSFAKSNAGAFTKSLLGDCLFCRVQDIEDYGEYHCRNFKDLLKSRKDAKSLMRKVDFYIAYSNFTFETWIIAHKIQVPSVIDRAEYYKTINGAYNTSFLDNDDYKHEKNFKGLLNGLCLDDVISSALPECARFKKNNVLYHSDKKRSLYGFDYYLNDPDTTVDDFVRVVLRYAGYDV